MLSHMARMCWQATFSTTADVIGSATSFFLLPFCHVGKQKKLMQKLNEILNVEVFYSKFLMVWPKKWPYIRLLWPYSRFIFTINSPKWFGSWGKWSYNRIVLISGVFISGFYCTCIHVPWGKPHNKSFFRVIILVTLSQWRLSSNANLTWALMQYVLQSVKNPHVSPLKWLGEHSQEKDVIKKLKTYSFHLGAWPFHLLSTFPRRWARAYSVTRQVDY